MHILETDFYILGKKSEIVEFLETTASENICKGDYESARDNLEMLIETNEADCDDIIELAFDRNTTMHIYRKVAE